VVIHATCGAPPRSPTIAGIAVETMVWSSAAIRIPASSAAKMTATRRRVSTMTGVVPSVGGACMVELLGGDAVAQSASPR